MEEIFKNSKRIHDDFYLSQKFTIKESFKFLLEEIKTNHKNNFTLIDIGCATGVFLSYVNQELKNVSLSGADILDSLLTKAKENCPSAKYYNIDIFDEASVKKNLNENKFDAVVLDGVHPIFDEALPWINNLINIVSDEGIIYIFGSFNEAEYDVITRVKSIDSDTWEKGWNRFSLKTIEKLFNEKKFDVKMKRFDIDIDINKTNDPRRTYTHRLKDGSLITRNGLELISTPYLMICEKKH